MDVSLALDVAEVVYRKGTVRDLAVAVEIHKGVITVPQLKAVLPGDMRVQATVEASGELSVTGPRLRETLAWLEIDPSGVPADKLQRLDLKGKLAATANGVQIADLVAELDGQRATGSGSVTFGTPLAAGGDAAGRPLRSRRLPAGRAGDGAERAADAAGRQRGDAVGGHRAGRDRNAHPRRAAAARSATPVFALKAKVAKLTFRKQILGGVEGDASVQGNLLKVNAFKVADLLGAKADVKGSVTDFAAAPRYDLTFNATLPDADKVIDYAGLPKFINGKIGARVGERRRGRHDERAGAAQRQRDAAGQHGRHATGTLALGSNFRFDFPTFQSADPGRGRLVAAATGRAPAAIGAISAAGAFKGDGQRVAFDGSLTALGTAMTGHVDATLGKRPNINVNLRVPGTLDLDHWLGVSPGPPAACSAGAGTGAASAARGDRQADRSLGPARLRCHREARDQRRRGRLDQGRLCRPARPAARAACARSPSSPASSTAAPSTSAAPSTPPRRAGGRPARAACRASISARCCAARPAPTVSATTT